MTGDISGVVEKPVDKKPKFLFNCAPFTVPVSSISYPTQTCFPQNIFKDKFSIKMHVSAKTEFRLPHIFRQSLTCKNVYLL